jgi:hypothetical protein
MMHAHTNTLHICVQPRGISSKGVIERHGEAIFPRPMRNTAVVKEDSTVSVAFVIDPFPFVRLLVDMTVEGAGSAK